ncbi:MAG TPA: acyltransferase [Rhizomicrobium sp.]|jgi:acetyltransferase-like isoleucine patch superfamily enzyme
MASQASLEEKEVRSYLRACIPETALPEYRASRKKIPLEDWVQFPLVEFVNSPKQREFFAPSCRFLCPRDAVPVAKDLEIYRIGLQAVIDDVTFCMDGALVKGIVGLGRSGSKFFFSRDSNCQIDMRAWRAARLFVGAQATINSARIVLDDGQVYLGPDAMLSDEILVQAGDQHSIWDLESKKVLNKHQQPIIVGEHAWIGRRVTLLAGAVIGCGAIVGAASVVTREIAPFSAAVGVPARVVKERVTWSRNVEWLSPQEREFLARRNPTGEAPAVAGSPSL